MTVALPGAPFAVTHRELLLPSSIEGNATLRHSVDGGHDLALTGAQKRTTCDGVHFDRSVNSSIDCGVIDNASAKYWVSLWFKLDATRSPGVGLGQYFWGKRIGGADFLWLRLVDTSSTLQLGFGDGGVSDFGISTLEQTFIAGQLYHVFFSIGQATGGGAPTDGARLRLDGDTYVNATSAPLPNGANIVIGSRNVGGGGILGTISDVFMGTDDITEAEEDDLRKGIPPADTVHEYPLDEGRGVIAHDRGSGGNNGALASGCTWDFGQVQQPVLSLNGINDRGQSAAGVNISGGLTLATVIKAKSTYNGLAADHYLAHLFADADNELRIYYDFAADVLRFYAEGGGTSQAVDYATKPAIDDYLILLLALSDTGVLRASVNGLLVGTTTGVGPVVGAATTYIGCEQTPGSYDISKPLLMALIDGAFTQKQALAYTRYLKNIYNLPITV